MDNEYTSKIRITSIEIPSEENKYIGKMEVKIVNNGESENEHSTA